MGRPIPEMDGDELAAALKAAIGLLQSVPSASFLRSDIDVRETSTGTTIGRSFKWAFIPADQLWSDEDRRDVQSRLDECAARHGLQGATVRFGSDRLEVAVPGRLQVDRSSPSRVGWTPNGKHSTSAKCRDAARLDKKPWPSP
jgi:hypothetical protein